MTKKRLLSLAVASLMVIGMTGLSMAGIPDPTNSTASSGSGCVEIAMDGNGKSLAAAGLTVSVTVLDGNGDPVVGYPFQDIWLGDNSGGTEISLCNGGSAAAANTNASGFTTITGSISGGGTTTSGMQVYLAGVPLNGAALLLDASSPDLIDASGPGPGSDLVVDTQDLTYVPGGFANLFLNGVYDTIGDFNCDTVENILEVTRFAELFLGSVTCP
jgi:hypothetical protein